MTVTKVFKIKNDIIAYCIGDDLPKDIDNQKVLLGGVSFDVLKYGRSTSFTGIKNALIQLDAERIEDIPLGEVIFV